MTKRRRSTAKEKPQQVIDRHDWFVRETTKRAGADFERFAMSKSRNSRWSEQGTRERRVVVASLEAENAAEGSTVRSSCMLKLSLLPLTSSLEVRIFPVLLLLPTYSGKSSVSDQLAPGCPDITVSPGQLNTGDSYSYDFAGQGFGATQTFTLKNEGTGTSEVLGFSMSGTGFAFSADTCSGGALPAGGTCTFRMTFTPGACQAPFLMDIGVTGGVPPTIEYLELILIASCST